MSSGTVFVVNKYKHVPTDHDVYIGRGSPLGSPYSHLPSKKEGIIKVDTREEAISLYKDWLKNMIYTLQNKAVVDEINKLIKMTSEGDVNLVCFCSPKPCHGEVIAAMLKHLMCRDLVKNKRIPRAYDLR